MGSVVCVDSQGRNGCYNPLKRPIEMAARQRIQDSAMEQGRKYFYGIRTKKNYRKAFPLLLDAARHGSVHAQFMVGFAYRDGLGTKEKLAQSRRWWASAAKRDHPGALFNLALDYDYGRGVQPNSRKAFGLYKRGAEFGDRDAQCNLAVAYMNGRGIERDFRKGIYWMKRAALQGDPRITRIKLPGDAGCGRIFLLGVIHGEPTGNSRISDNYENR